MPLFSTQVNGTFVLVGQVEALNKDMAELLALDEFRSQYQDRVGNLLLGANVDITAEVIPQ